MREIKFRAWDSDKNKMVEIELIKFDSSDSSGVVGWDYYDFCDGDVGNRYSREVLMQFTGLKDKNGVEIYEGDVVKNDLISWSHEVDVAQVLFNEGAYYLLGNHGYHVQMRSKHSPNMEVIGNIYENPGLLPPPQSGEKGQDAN